MHFSLFILIMILPFCGELSANIESLKGNLIYENTFDTDESMDDFVGEGPVINEIHKGKLYLASWDSLRKTQPSTGNFVYWCKAMDHPESYIIEYEFTPLRKYGTCILFTCARGKSGEDIFDPGLQKREGQYSVYHSGDIDNYGFSYYRNKTGHSGIVNLRKNYGFKIVASAKDPIPFSNSVGKTYRIAAVKDKGMLQYYINSKLVLQWIDSKPWGSGKFGLREMAMTKAYYDNLKVWGVSSGSSSIKHASGNRIDSDLIGIYPNPFNGRVTISMQNAKGIIQNSRLAFGESRLIKFGIYRLDGRILNFETHNFHFAENHQVQWDGKDNRGTPVPSGLYLVRVKFGNQVYTEKLIRRQ